MHQYIPPSIWNEVTVGQFKQFVADSGYTYNWWDQVARGISDWLPEHDPLLAQLH